MKISIKRLALGIASAGLLTIYGCGGGGGTTIDEGPAPSMTVTPSLGKFSAGTQVKLKKLDASELSAGSIGTDGKATLSLARYTGPVVVEVLGGVGVTYWDEKLDPSTGKGTTQPFGAGKKLRAVVPTPMSQVGVTALTNAAAAKLEAAAGGIAGATADTIKVANNKIAAVFGLPDILVAPNPVDGSTGNTLNLATPGDKYALVLAALAKTAPDGAQAAEVADALAHDLKDDKLDGRDGTSSTPSAAIANAPTAATLADKYQEAARESLNESSKSLALLDPLVVTTDVTAVTAVSNQSDVTLAKAMFAELRTTLNSFANGNTGFLDSQATRMNADLNANVAPQIEKIANRLDALGNTMSAFENVTANGNPGFATNLVLTSTTGATALVRQRGSLQNVWSGNGSFSYCWKGGITGVQTTGKVTCAHAGSDSADFLNNRTKMMVFELTAGTAVNQYTYTATRYNMDHVSGQTTPTTISFVLGSIPGSGTVGKTTDGTKITGITLNGTLPASTDSTGADTVVISAVRTALTAASAAPAAASASAAPTAASNFRYALSGSVSTVNSLDSAKVVTLSFDSGSFFDADESTASTTGSKVLAAKLIGTAKTAASKFTGTLDIGSFVTEIGGGYTPTKIVFVGSISDTSTSGAGEFLTGKLEAVVEKYSEYNSTLPDSSSNYQHATVTFTGTVQAPGRPALTLVLAAVKTAPNASNMTLIYTYGTVKITGSGATDGDKPGSDTMILSNQDGIQVDIQKMTVTKAGAAVATIVNGAINYVDGVTESLI